MSQFAENFGYDLWVNIYIYNAVDFSNRQRLLTSALSFWAGAGVFESVRNICLSRFPEVTATRRTGDLIICRNRSLMLSAIILRII